MIIFISASKNMWKVHIEERTIGELFILKSVAIIVAINYVKSLPQGRCKAIRVQNLKSGYYTYWDLEKDEYPPQKKPFRSIKKIQ